jgi:hypothetical protein
MAAKTAAQYQALLDKVDTCIEAILAGAQDVSFGDRRYTRADLGSLQQLRSHYEEMIDRITMAGTGSRRLAEF